MGPPPNSPDDAVVLPANADLIESLQEAYQIIQRVYMSGALGNATDAIGEILTDLCVAEFAMREALRNAGSYPIIRR